MALTVAVYAHKITTVGYVRKSVIVIETSSVTQSMVVYKTVGEMHIYNRVETVRYMEEFSYEIK